MDKGYGLVNKIISILEEIPLGPFRIPAGLKLREAMLINGILFNSEVWYDVKEDEVNKLKSVDDYLLRKILGAPSKTPKEALYLETGCVPLDYIMKSRRLMYLHHLVRRPKEELIRRFYEAQKCKSSKGDWVLTVMEDAKELKIDIDEEKLSQTSKEKFRRIIKNKVAELAYESLIRKKNTHSKMENIQYREMELQGYLKSNCKLKYEDKQLLFKLRTRMTEVKHNFRNKYADQICPLCKSEEDTQYHLINCQRILENCPDLAENINIEYEDIFSNGSKQMEAAILFSKVWKTREKLLDVEI